MEKSSGVLEINENEFVKIVNDKKAKIVLVDFYANWCGPCQMMAPVLKSVSGKIGDKAIIAKINVDDAPTLSEKYEISSIPCMIVFKSGKELKRIVGYRDEKTLIEEINSLL